MFEKRSYKNKNSRMFLTFFLHLWCTNFLILNVSFFFFSVSLVLGNMIMLYVSAFFFVVIHFEGDWICGIVVIIKLGNILALITSNIFCPLTLWESDGMSVRPPGIAPQVIASLFIFKVFFSCTQPKTYIYIF